MQLGLARAVSTNGIDVHPGPYHFGCQDQGVALVSGHCRDNVGALNGFRRRMAAHDLQSVQPEACEIALQLHSCLWIRVIQTHLADAHM